MNKRQAKKKYKEIYEEKLKEQEILIDLRYPAYYETRKVKIKHDGGEYSICGISFDNFTVEPFSTDLYPEINISGRLMTPLITRVE